MTTINMASIRLPASASLNATSAPEPEPCGIQFQNHLIMARPDAEATPVSSTTKPAGSGIWNKLCVFFERAHSFVKSAFACVFGASPASVNATSGSNAPTFHNVRSVAPMRSAPSGQINKPEIPAGLLDNGYPTPDNWQQRSAPGPVDRRAALMDELETRTADLKTEVDKALAQPDLRDLASRAAALEGASSVFLQTRRPAVVH